MIQKHFTLKTLSASLVLLGGCVNNTLESAEDLLDCSASDLQVDVVSSLPSGCESAGSVTLAASGGSGVYTYSANGVDYQEEAIINGLFAGTLQLFVQDADGCVVSTSFELASEASGISISSSSTASDCLVDSGTIEVIATGGEGSITYALGNADFQASSTFSNVGAGTYTITAKDENGCEAQSTVTVGVSSTVSLASDIAPVLSANCAVSGCHNGTVFPNLSATNEIISNASQILSRTSSGNMPPGSRQDLSQTQIDQIACWIEDGTKDN